MKIRPFQKGVGKSTGYSLFLSLQVAIRKIGEEGTGAPFGIGVPPGEYRKESIAA